MQSFNATEPKDSDRKIAITNPLEAAYGVIASETLPVNENIGGKYPATSLLAEPLSPSGSTSRYTTLVSKNNIRRSILRESSWRQREVDFVLPVHDPDPFGVDHGESSFITLHNRKAHRSNRE